jgi:FMN phosphatase YigB (HAD superfamily)
MSRLVVFDIDGTLTDTNDVDDECFRRAVADIFALSYTSLDWSDAPLYLARLVRRTAHH